MTPEEWNEGMNNLDMDLIEDHIIQQSALIRGNRRNRLWLGLGAAAACLALLAGVFFLTPRPGVSPKNPIALGPGDFVTVPTDPRPENPTTTPTSPSPPPATLPPDTPTTPPPDDPITPTPDDPITPPPDDPITLPPLQSDRYSDLSGSSLIFVKGSSTAVSTGGGQAEHAPPEFTFFPYQFTVVARVVENYPDDYYHLDVNSTYNPAAYRLVRMQVIQTLHGENLPREFLYLLPKYLYVDMSAYDCLLISMTQLGTENYVLRNGTQNRMEACPLPLFKDCQNQPELGGIIAFTDGIFDESLWQNESWRYGYQFGGYYLDNPQHGNLVVRRGGSLEETIANINQRLETNAHHYPTPLLVTWDFETQAAKDVLALVKPFENGVFSQSLNVWSGGGRLTFRRYINGCQTEEHITIDLTTEEVTRSEVQYTAEDIEDLQNIALYLSEQAAAYAQNLPTPPHTDPEGKDLLCLSLYAWYAKVDGKLYGVVKTAWRYCEADDWYIQYYDDQYILFDMTDGIGRELSRDDLLALLGERNVYTGPYGLGELIPM